LTFIPPEAYSVHNKNNKHCKLLLITEKSGTCAMNLHELIKGGESETLEFKEKFDERTVDSAVAFANEKGGTILIGISDKGVVNGTVIGKETLSQWANQISSKTEPQLIPLIETHQLEGKKIVAVKIPEYPLKPVSVRGKCFGG
jgi:ATP-dependent DNA helicase RecG